MKQKIFILLCTIGICISVHAKKYIVHSPDNKIKVSITADKQLIWSIDYNGERILTPSAIQMNIEGLNTTGYKPGCYQRKSRQDQCGTNCSCTS